MHLIIIAADFGHDFRFDEIGLELPPSWEGRFFGDVLNLEGAKANDILATARHAASRAGDADLRTGDPSMWSDADLIEILTRRSKARADLKRAQIEFLMDKIAEPPAMEAAA